MVKWPPDESAEIVSPRKFRNENLLLLTFIRKKHNPL
jgi:hypothetical protein